MQVETYEIEETTSSLEPDCGAEALLLVESLGLEGQKSLSPKPGVRIPYAEMTRQEIAVYQALFPEESRIEKYSAGLIPVRVLQVAALAKEQFTYLEVWHRRVRDPDPILVGIIKVAEYQFRRFLLARWGEALRPFSDLVDEARNILRTKLAAELETKINDLKTQLASVNALVEKKLAGEYVGF